MDAPATRLHGTVLARSKGRAAVSVLACLLAVANLGPERVRAAGTDPKLALYSARAFENDAGAAAIEISGSFQLDDLIQFHFPAGLLVSRGDSYVLYELDGAITAGTFPALANGVSAADVTALLAADGDPASPPAAVLRVAPAVIAVALPQSFGTGVARLTFYTLLEGETFVSNPLDVTVP